MILQKVPDDIEIVQSGVAPRFPGRRPLFVSRVVEYMGGLGDVVLRLRSTPWYADLDRLPPGEKVAVVLMCHNPGAPDLWRSHPKAGQLIVFDLGMALQPEPNIYPWENEIWRASCGLPERSPFPSPHDGSGVRFYPSPIDLAYLDSVPPMTAVFSPVAGTSERTFPELLQISIIDSLLERGLRPLLVGHGKYGRPVRHRTSECIDLFGKLSVPGVAEAIRRSAVIVTAHSATLHIAWAIDRPVVLAYPKWVADVFDKHGSVGYFFGANRTNTYHSEFSRFSIECFRDRLKRVL